LPQRAWRAVRPHGSGAARRMLEAWRTLKLTLGPASAPRAGQGGVSHLRSGVRLFSNPVDNSRGMSGVVIRRLGVQARRRAAYPPSAPGRASLPATRLRRQRVRPTRFGDDRRPVCRRVDRPGRRGPGPHIELALSQAGACCGVRSECSSRYSTGGGAPPMPMSCRAARTFSPKASACSRVSQTSMIRIVPSVPFAAICSWPPSGGLSRAPTLVAHLFVLLGRSARLDDPTNGHGCTSCCGSVSV
jgi:hypothetical protein